MRRTFQSVARQSEIKSQMSLESWQEISPADIREQAYRRLRHSEKRLLRSDSVSAMYGQADATSHRYSIDESYVGRLVRCD